MAVTLTEILGRSRQPTIVNPTAVLEDRRTRYIYSPCDTFYTMPAIIGNKKIGEDRGWSMAEITQGMIIPVEKRDNYDSNLTEAEMNSAAAYYRSVNPQIRRRDGESGTAGLVVRPCWPMEQVTSIVAQYAEFGLVELVSPLRYRDADLPAGWSVQEAVVKVLDFVLHPKGKDRVNIRENLDYFRKEAEAQLSAPLETRAGGITYLPPVIQEMGQALLGELIAATVSGVEVMLSAWGSVVSEITNRNTGKDRGQGELRPKDLWLQQQLGVPAPDALKLNSQKDNEAATEARTAGLVERIMDRIGDKLRPAPAQEINQEELVQKAADLAQQMVKATLEQMAADGRITFNSGEPKAEKKEKSK